MVKPEKARQLIEMLRPAQLAVYICDECGMDEALRDMAGTPLPLAEWAMVRSFTEHRR